VKLEAVRNRFIVWIDRSRIDRFLFFFPVSTLTMFLIEYVVASFRVTNSRCIFALIWGFLMGIYYAFRTPIVNAQQIKFPPLGSP
jgi:hypothetical protein